MVRLQRKRKTYASASGSSYTLVVNLKRGVSVSGFERLAIAVNGDLVIKLCMTMYGPSSSS